MTSKFVKLNVLCFIIMYSDKFENLNLKAYLLLFST